MKYIFISFIFILGIFLTGCSKKSDADYMSIADKSIKENNIKQGIEAYQTLVKEFPDSPKAPEALFHVATLYQNMLVKDIPEQESLEKAVDFFGQVFEKYPNSSIAPKSLFMEGFVLANDMHDLNRATKVFKTFLQKYPNNELSASAREELSNMGMTPAEILEKKKDSNI